MAFIYLNAETDGLAIYESLSLRGHPSYIIFDTNGDEVFRALGYQDETLLEETIQASIEEGN
ncbi:MAG: hypothetical protein WBC91_15320 [Phototrophicaceae bacterium]